VGVGASIAELPIAFLAGLLSLVTPCVLPLVPGYLSTVSAVEADSLGQPGSARRVLAGALPFVLGFTLVFVAVGAAAATLAAELGWSERNAIAGFLLVVIGLTFMGLLPLPKRLVGAGLLGTARDRGSSVLLGAAFAVCATPCIGAVLGGVLVLAGGSGSALGGAVVLAAYSLGLATGFLLAGLAFARAMGAFRWLRDRYLLIQVVSGAVLVALGLLLFFEREWWLQVAVNRTLRALGLGGV
jgi:cytochrome c-type biogenesis protein